MRPLTPREEKLVELLWDYLKKCPEHEDRRQTSYGTKTKVGLVNTIAWIMDERREI